MRERAASRPLAILQDRLRGKIASYWLNAADDTQIARHLIAYVVSGEPPPDTPTGQRARRLLTVIPDDDYYHDRVLLVAYTEQRVNGMADIVWAWLLDGWLGTSMIADHPYDEAELSFWRIFDTWSGLVLGGDLRKQQAYAQQHADRALTLPPREAARELVRVQRENIRVNGLTRQSLVPDRGAPPGSKIDRLLTLARESTHPDAFLKGAINTQTAAAWWDRLFAALIRLRWWI